jgi:hypothetical protein
MHPDKVDRNRLNKLTDLPNIGPAGAKDYQLLGYQIPQQLVGVSALHLYQQLCAVTGQIHAPCVLDVMLSVEHFLAGDAPQVWWAYTTQRQHLLALQG